MGKRVKVKKKSSPCRTWAGANNGKYGVRKIPGTRRNVYVHRDVWQKHHHRPIPVGCEIHHLCHNTLCYERSHLMLVTDGMNRRLERKEFCGRGHKMEGKNVGVNKTSGWRYCKACHSYLEKERRKRVALVPRTCSQ